MQQQGEVIGFESQVYRKDGSIIWISENTRAVYGDQGTLLYYEGIVEDITERKQTEAALRAEQEKSERLLLNILPKAIAEQLKQGQGAIATRFEAVTVLFSDIVDFTGIASRLAPTELVTLLNEVFSTFDQLAEDYGLEKIKTIGDAYMVVGGLPEPRSDHAEAIAEMALKMQEAISQLHTNQGDLFRLRIGINTGPFVAGVIGIKKFSYDLWGDTVNVASRMETHGEIGRIHVTEAAYQCLKDTYEFAPRGTIAVKGKGTMNTYFLAGRKASCIL
jgi:class 3 adenylate cyclase